MLLLHTSLSASRRWGSEWEEAREVSGAAKDAKLKKWYRQHFCQTMALIPLPQKKTTGRNKPYKLASLSHGASANSLLLSVLVQRNDGQKPKQGQL